MEQKAKKNFTQQVLKADLWIQIENFIGEELPLCFCRILNEAGYNTSMALSSIQTLDIDTIEECVNKELRYIIDDLDCCNSTTYQKQKEFHFLPGHRKLILKLKDHLHEMHVAKTSISSQRQSTLKHSNEFSTLLKMLIETAGQNANKIPTQYRYSETIRYFAVYIYMTCGKMCYETLCRNLPLPQPSSIRKFF